MKLSFTAQLAKESLYYILLVKGKNRENLDVYAYISIPMDGLDEFAEAQKSERIALEAYGKILKTGEGEPSLEVQAEMEELYNFQHNDVIVLR